MIYSRLNQVLRHLSNEELLEFNSFTQTLTCGMPCDLELAVLFELSRRRGLQLFGHYSWDIDQRHKWTRYATDTRLQTASISG